MLSNHTSKEQVLKREGKTKPLLSPSEALLQGNWGTAARSPGSASTAPLTPDAASSLPGAQCNTLNVLDKINRAEHKCCFPDPIVLLPFKKALVLTLTDTQGTGII